MRTGTGPSGGRSFARPVPQMAPLPRCRALEWARCGRMRGPESRRPSTNTGFICSSGRAPPSVANHPRSVLLSAPPGVPTTTGFIRSSGRAPPWTRCGRMRGQRSRRRSTKTGFIRSSGRAPPGVSNHPRSVLPFPSPPVALGRVSPRSRVGSGSSWRLESPSVGSPPLRDLCRRWRPSSTAVARNGLDVG